MKLLIDEIDRKTYLWSYLGQVAIYFGWYIYIFGVLGHVCPVAFIGSWSASLVGQVYFTGKRPRFLGCLISFIAMFILWGITFLFLHPNEVYGFLVDEPYRVVTWSPFLMFFVNAGVCLLIQIYITNYQKPWKINYSIRIEIIWEKFLSLITILIGTIGFIAYFFFKDDIWNDDVQDWFDTQFYPGDLWYLFLFIMIIALFSALSMIYSILLKRKSNKEAQNKVSLAYLLGFSLLGLVLFGTFGIFIYLGRKSVILESND